MFGLIFCVAKVEAATGLGTDSTYLTALAAYALIQWAKEKNHYYNSKAGHLALGEHED